MSYIQINEDFKAFAHNAISGMIGGRHHQLDKHNIVDNVQQAFGLFMLGLNPLATIAKIGLKLIGAKDMMDRAFFNRYWDSEKIIRTIEPWCKQVDTAVFVSKNNTNNMANYDSRSIMGKKQKAHIAAKSNSYLANQSIFKKSERKDKFTTALTCLPIKSGNGFYYVYPVFDTGKIKSIKILCSRNKSNTALYMKELEQWKKIDQSQFRKDVLI